LCRDAIFSFTFFAAENAVFFSWFFALFLQTANCAAKHGSIFLAPPTFGGECNNTRNALLFEPTKKTKKTRKRRKETKREEKRKREKWILDT
jgi:hypothetical protein